MHATVELGAALLAAVVAIAAVASRARVPAPVALVAGGLALGFIPGIPDVNLDPDLVLFAFLPPLVYAAAFFGSRRELRDHASQVGLLALGLVVVTVAGVAAVAHWVAGLDWAPAFVLGAVLGPTDPIAATAITKRLGAPGSITTLLEGEALINDGTALAVYKIALGAAVSGTFALGSAGLKFVGVAVGGAAIGLFVGWAAIKARRRIEDPQLEIAFSLLTPFLAYLPAERAGASGVLAAVVAGLYVGWYSSEVVSAGTRLQSASFWRVVQFTFESALFLLVGLQTADVVSRVSGAPLTLIGEAAAVVGLIFVVRFAWMFTVVRMSGVPPRQLVVLGWSGMRGAVSFAAALAVPLAVEQRDLILFLTIATVLATLVLPSLTLGRLVCALDLGIGEEERRREVDVRIRLAQVALERLEEVSGDELPEEEVMGRMRGLYEARLDRLEALRDDPDGEDGDSRSSRPLRRALVTAEREELSRLREERELSPEVAEEIREDLDLEEARLSKEQ